MAWSLTSEGNDKGYSVYSETLTTKSVGNGTSNWSSIINFIPKGADFTVIANTAATNLSTSTHVELFVSYTPTSSSATSTGRALRYRSAVTPFIPVTSEIDSVTKLLLRDVSVRGEYPYYFLKIPKGGGSVTLKVIVNAVQGNF